MAPRLRLSDPLLRVQSDERLAALAGHGGERAFAVLVERHRGPLLAFARRLGAGAGAEDVVQQTLLQAWSALQRGARVEHVSAWMHQIARNAAIRAAAASLDSAELPATLVAPSQTAEEVELRHETRRLLAEIERLPARQREALVRLAVSGSSGDEAGAAMDLEANAVRQLAFRARTRLRAAMGACVPWPLALWAARGGGSLAAGLPEAIGGAGVASGAGAAGLLKVGAIASTTVAVAVGAGGIVQHHRDRQRPAAATRSHVVAAASAATPATAAVPTQPLAHRVERAADGRRRSARSGRDASGDGSHAGSTGERVAGVEPSGSSGSGTSSGDRHSGRDGGSSHQRGGDRAPAASEPVQTETEHGDSSGSSQGGDGSPTNSGGGSGDGGGDRHASDGSHDGSGSGSSDGGGGDNTPASDALPGDG